MKDRPPCPNPECVEPHVIGNGSNGGKARYVCRGCGRYFGATEGTPMYHLHTPVQDVVHALLVVMRRGSLRAAEDITHHKYETIGIWLRRAAAHAEALTAVLVQELHLTTVEIDEFWSFVRKKTASLGKPMPESDGGASSRIAPVGSLLPRRLEESAMDW